MLIDAAFLLNIAVTALIDGICCAHFLRADQTRMESYRSEIRQIIEEEFERLVEMAKKREQEAPAAAEAPASSSSSSARRRRQEEETNKAAAGAKAETKREEEIREIIQQEFEELANRTLEKILAQQSFSDMVVDDDNDDDDDDDDDDEQWKDDLRRDLRAGLVDRETFVSCLPRRKSRPLLQRRAEGGKPMPFSRFQSQGQSTRQGANSRFVRPLRESSFQDFGDLETQDTEETVSTSSFSSKSPPRRRRHRQHEQDRFHNSSKGATDRRSSKVATSVPLRSTAVEAYPRKAKQLPKPKTHAQQQQQQQQQHYPQAADTEIKRAPSGITTWTI